MEKEIIKEETCPITLPFDREHTAPVFVSVNERTWLIRRGETVRVPLCVKEVLDHQTQSDMEALRYEQVTSKDE